MLCLARALITTMNIFVYHLSVVVSGVKIEQKVKPPRMRKRQRPPASAEPPQPTGMETVHQPNTMGSEYPIVAPFALQIHVPSVYRFKRMS